MGSPTVATTPPAVAPDASPPFPSAWRWWTASATTAAVGAAIAAFSVAMAVAVAASCFALQVGWSDLRWRRIPNAVVVASLGFAFGVAALGDEVLVPDVTVGALLMASPALGLHLVDPRWVGFGDVKLLAGYGALFGVLWWPAGLVVLWVAIALAVACHPFVPASWRRSVPFGFWLSVVSVPASIVLAGSVGW